MNNSIMPPGHFMPAAERYHLSSKIDAWVFSHTLAFLSAHRQVLDQVEQVHINLSAPTISDVDFYRFVVKQFRRYDVPHHKICFEVTETMAIANTDYSVRIMNNLRKRGIHFALDDFGCGMSSYAYLRTLPVDLIKIDGSFIRDIADPVSCAIVESINHIAHMSGKRTVAEFVESEECAQRLRELKVDYMQGYHFGKPAPIEHLLNLIS